MRNKKNKRIMWAFLLLFAITVGYAVISTQLKIDGVTLLQKQTWDVHWENPVVTEGSVTVVPPQLTSDDTVATWYATLSFPGDFYEFTIDAVNAGSIDAKIKVITSEINPTKPDYINYSVTYENGDPLEVNHVLAKATNGEPTKETYKVRVAFNDNIDMETYQEISQDTIYEFKFKINYAQANYTPSQNAPIPKDKGTCPGENCVYRSIVYGENIELHYGGANASTFTNYTKDYTKLTRIAYKEPGSDTIYNGQSDCENYEYCYEVEARARDFIGCILDQNGKIQRAFLCRIFEIDTPNEKVLCLEGSKNNKIFEENVKKITSYTDEYNSDDDGVSIEEDTDYYIKTKSDGEVILYAYSRGSETKDCRVTPTGELNCFGFGSQ